jgi:hypothetical protein
VEKKPMRSDNMPRPTAPEHSDNEARLNTYTIAGYPLVIDYADYLALAARLAAVEAQNAGLVEQHGRDSAELRALCEARDVWKDVATQANNAKADAIARAAAAESALAALRERVLGVAAEWVMPDPTWRGGVTDAFNQCADDVLAAIGPVDGCDSAQEKQK